MAPLIWIDNSFWDNHQNEGNSWEKYLIIRESGINLWVKATLPICIFLTLQLSGQRIVKP